MRNLTLCLGQSHAVAGDDDDLLCILQGLTYLCLGETCLCYGSRSGSGSRLDRSGEEALDLCHRGLGVAQHHENIGSTVQGILNACVAGLGIEVAEHGHGSLLYREDRHAVNGSTLGSVCRRIGNIVGADNDSQITGSEVVVDVFHHEQLLVINIGLAQQDAHVSGHTACNGVNGELHLYPSAF